MLGSGSAVVALLCQDKDGNEFISRANIYHQSKQRFPPLCVFLQLRQERRDLLCLRCIDEVGQGPVQNRWLCKHCETPTPWTIAELNAVVMLWAQQRSSVNI